MKHKLLIGAAVAVALVVAAEHSVVKPVLAQVRAALVQNVDEPGRTPFALAGSATNGNFFSFNVPAGQRYVVESVTGECFENTPGVLTDILLVGHTNGVTTRLSTQPHLYQSNGPNQNIYIGTGNGVLYADPASTLQVFANDNLAGGGIQNCQFWVNGHTISNP